MLASGLLGFWQERGAAHAVDKLLAVVQIKATVLRDGARQEVPIAEVVPGDVVVLSAGESVPGDCLLLESNGPVRRRSGPDRRDLPGRERPLSGPAGGDGARPAHQHPVHGHARGQRHGRGLVVRTGTATEFGKVSERLSFAAAGDRIRARRPAVRLPAHGGHARARHRHLRDQRLPAPARPRVLLFSLALAVGLTPQLLPAIISINLAHGARRMARGKVIVKRLAVDRELRQHERALLGQDRHADRGHRARARGASDVDGEDSEKVLLYAFLNARFETGFANPIDEAIRRLPPVRRRRVPEARRGALRLHPQAAERPGRRRRPAPDGHQGRAGERAGGLHDRPRPPDGTVVPVDAGARDDRDAAIAEFSGEGFRTLGVA